MKTQQLLALLSLLVLWGSCKKVPDDFWEHWKDPHGHPGTATVIKNPSFEKSINFDNPAPVEPWLKLAYLPASAIYEWGAHIGRNNTGGVSLESGDGVLNDIAIGQDIALDPSKFYELHGWIKTADVRDGTGANICLYGTWTASATITGTTDWQEVKVEIPPGSTNITIACRLGYWGGAVLGKAWFDDISLVEVKKFSATGKHLRLVLDEADVEGIPRRAISNWVTNLDQAYEKMGELMGGYPYNGNIITIASVADYPGGWAVAGNPILWYKPYIKQELQAIASSGTWSFGIMHELGHDFILENSNTKWVFHEEMFANFRMYYAVEKLNATIQQDRIYKGRELEAFYKTNGEGSYAQGIEKGIPSGYNGVMYTLLRIKNLIGWAPVKAAIRDLNASSAAPATNWEKFNLLLDKLTQYSGRNVRSTYQPGELATIEQLMILEQ